MVEIDAVVEEEMPIIGSSETEAPGSMGGSERIKIGERPPEQSWPGGSGR